MAFQRSVDVPYGSKMLWASVLRRSIFDYVLYKGVGAHALEWKRSVQYIFSVGQRYTNGLSFEGVCELFGWDADYLRRMATKLTRDDIKKMETTQFREDFVFDIVKAVVEQTEKWKSFNFATPFLPLYRYSPEYRERIRPRVIRKEVLIGSGRHLTQWRAMA